MVKIDSSICVLLNLAQGLCSVAYCVIVIQVLGATVLRDLCISVAVTVGLKGILFGKAASVAEVSVVWGDVLAALRGTQTLLWVDPYDAFLGCVQFVHVFQCYMMSYGYYSSTMELMCLTPLKATYQIFRVTLLFGAWTKLCIWLMTIFVFWQFCNIAANLGSHRYFSHRSYQTSRLMQLMIAAISAMSGQRGPLWWTSIHRDHHKFCDQPGDPHSPVVDGFWYAHLGWMLDARNFRIRFDNIQDWTCYRELLLVELVGPVLQPSMFTRVCRYFGLVPALATFGQSVSNHFESFINSLCHMPGKEDEASENAENRKSRHCKARNITWVAVLNGGEGFHDNHHKDPNCAQHGGKDDIDVVFSVICCLESLGVVWRVKRRPL